MKATDALAIETILFDRYRIERVIGQGGFGITYYAYHLQLGTYVAIKEFFLSGICYRTPKGNVKYRDFAPEKFEKLRKRFQEEANTLCRLNNPHVVSVRDIFDENGTTYIVMDYVEGETLQKKVERDGALSYDAAVNYMAQLCEAVEHIHSHHILHRDIKPDNIIITPQNNVVLIDFGSARGFVHDKEQKHTAMLTMGYAPIEQYTATSKKGNYTDLYAVGGTFYFILTGRKPIPAADRMLSDELLPPRAFNAAIPESASITIMKALNVKPEDRYQNVTEFQRDLLSGDSDNDEPQRPAPINPIPSPPKPDNKVMIVLLSVFGGLMLLGMLFWGVRSIAEFSRNNQNKHDEVSIENNTPSISPDLSSGYIKDEDGWTNVRAGRSRKAEIITKIKDGTEILYRPDASGWYDVYDTDGTRLGYVHTSLIIPAYTRTEDATTGASQQNHDADYFNPDRDDVQTVLQRFTYYDNNDDFDGLRSYYAPYVERYYSVEGISREDIIVKHQNYNEKFGVNSKVGTYRWKTLEIHPISSDRVAVVCVMDYVLDRQDPTKPTHFVLEKHFVFNRDYQIVSIYDNQLEKW